MKKEILLLFLLNGCSGIGYSIIAPLYPSEAYKHGIGEYISGIIISMFALSSFIASPFSPYLINKFGRKNILYTACLLEVN